MKHMQMLVSDVLHTFNAFQYSCVSRVAPLLLSKVLIGHLDLWGGQYFETIDQRRSEYQVETEKIDENVDYIVKCFLHA